MPDPNVQHSSLAAYEQVVPHLATLWFSACSSTRSSPGSAACRGRRG